MDFDESQIEALKAGDPQATDRFYRAYAESVLGWAIRLGGPNIDAEDVAQDVFAIALRKVGSFRGDSRITTWLFSITRNVINNARRRAAIRRWVGLETVAELEDHRPRADDRLDRQRQRQLVQTALDKLKGNQREVLVLMDLEGRTAPEVSQMLGIPSGTVYSRLHYARKAFASAIEREGYDPSLLGAATTTSRTS